MENFLDYIHRMKDGERIYGSLVLIGDQTRRVHGCLYKYNDYLWYFLHHDRRFNGNRPPNMGEEDPGYSWMLPYNLEKPNADCQPYSFEVDVSYIDTMISGLLFTAEQKLINQTLVLTTKT